MRLRVYNCSPRGRASNSRILSGAFVEGFSELTGNDSEEFFVAEQIGMETGLSSFGGDGPVLIVFPVYVDAMPGLAKDFFERIATFRGSLSRTRLLFMVHTGFPEETHTRPVAGYLARFCLRLGARLDGIIRMGGTEGIRNPGSSGRARMITSLRQLGKKYATEGDLDEKILKKLSGSAPIPRIVAMAALPFVNYFGFGRKLRENGAWESRFHRPL